MKLDITSTINEKKISNILYITAWVQILCAISLNFHENPKMRKFCVTTLICIILFIDTFLVNLPIDNGDPNNYSNQKMQCTANIAIVAGLVMILGLRDQPRRLV
jgi:hypothetical protein